MKTMTGKAAIVFVALTLAPFVGKAVVGKVGSQAVVKPAVKQAVKSAIEKTAAKRVAQKTAEKAADKMATKAVAKKAFVAESKEPLSKIPKEQLPVVIGMAERAESPAVRKAFIESVKKDPSILERLSPKQIMAYGLTGSMLVAAGGMAVNLDNPISQSIGHAVKGPFSVLAWGGVVLLLLSLLGLFAKPVRRGVAMIVNFGRRVYRRIVGIVRSRTDWPLPFYFKK